MTLTTRRTALLLASSLGLGAASAADAQPVSLSPEGIGQVLIYPYYTTRNGWTTLLSIVNNDATNGKAIKLRFLEGRNGAVVGALNIFLAPEHVWTGALAPGISNDSAARLVSTDTSCTLPTLSPVTGTVTSSLAFSNQAYVADGDSAAFRTLDRAREGYVEVIEMASIPFNADPSKLSALSQQIVSVRGASPVCTQISDATIQRDFSTDVAAPSGGLSGAATLINVVDGLSSVYSPIALNGFWLSNAFAPTQVTEGTSALPNLTSGGNTSAQNSYGGKDYFSKFSRSIDAVSAALMTDQMLGEHAFTIDGIVRTTWVVTAPTKRFYTQTSASPPFSVAWNQSSASACEPIKLVSFDRESFMSSDDGSCGFNECPPVAPRALCYSANMLSFGGVRFDGGDLSF